MQAPLQVKERPAYDYLPTNESDPSSLTRHKGNNDDSRGTTGLDEGVRTPEHDAYHKASLPSQGPCGAFPHERVGGVESLPRDYIEKGVALLPGEQAGWYPPLSPNPRQELHIEQRRSYPRDW